jgi:DCN1-like protein 1/2
VKKFISLTQTGEQTALFCLLNNEWKLDLACDNYFQNPEAYYRELDKKKIDQLFHRYRDPQDHQKICSDGVVKFLDDLHLSPESRLVLIIAWKFKAEQQCEFTRDEFVNGMLQLGVDSVDKLKAKLPALEIELNDVNKFKDFYQFTFNYAKESAQKGLDLDMAIAYWNIVLQGRFKFLDLWCLFLTVSCRTANLRKTVRLTVLIFNRKTTSVQYQKIRGTYY